MAKEKDVPKTGAATGATASSAVESAKVETDPAATGADEAMPLPLQASEAPQIEACADVAAAAVDDISVGDGFRAESGGVHSELVDRGESTRR